jgi:serine/threonine protein kinase
MDRDARRAGSRQTAPVNFGDGAHSGFLLAGRYRLVSPVGSGGTAVVWRAHDDVLDRIVAIKMLAAKHVGDPESRARIRHEARATAALNHPHVAQVHDYGEMVTDEGVFPYVVMEYVPGVTLLARLREGPLPARDAMRICSEIAAGLEAAHAQGLVHRDIKPANVILAPAGAKVVDFGIAAAIAPGRPTHEDFVVYGTPAYLAPERLIDDVVVPASDVYSVGILLYRLLTGRSPWDQEQTTRMLMAHVYLPPAPLGALSGVPPSVVELCHRCLEKDPAMRPAAREVAESLAGAAAEPSGAAAEPSGPAPPRRAGSAPARRRRIAWAATGTAIVAAAVTGIGWALWPDQHTVADRKPVAPAVSSPARSPLPSTSPSSPTATTPAAKVVTRTVTAGTPTPSAPTSTSTSAASPSASSRPPTPSAPATTAPPVRTFSSEAGEIRASCPTPGSARILAVSATTPYKIEDSDRGPGAAPFVIFRRGNARLTMTVTCDGDQPTVTKTTSQ